MSFREQPASYGKRHLRLERAAYAEIGAICSITIAVEGRRRVFMEERVAAAAVQVLHAHALKTEVPVYGYCVMPDHVHLVIGPSAGCDIVTFVGQFKNLAQRAAWQAGVQGRFWQHSFWDHFLRREESLECVVQYVLQNPVRGGLVAHWRDYPHAGSLEMDL